MTERPIEARLDELIASKNPGAREACEAVEVLLLRDLPDIALAAFGDHARVAHLFFQRTEPDGFVLGDDTYTAVSSDADGELTLRIREVHLKPAKTSKRHFQQSVAGNGRLQRVNLEVPDSFAALGDRIADQIASHIGAAYIWLEAYVMAELDGLRHGIADELYLRLRKRLPPSIVELIWLYVISEGNGIYVPDRIAQIEALKHAAGRTLTPSLSPLELVAEFTTRPIPFDRTHSEEAISTGAVLPQHFARAKYADTGFQLAEEAVYDCRDYLIHPLVREGNSLLTAGYPTSCRELVEVVLNSEKENFRTTLIRGASRVRTFLHRIQEQRSLPDWTKAAVGLSGKFLGGLFGLSP